MIPLLIQHDHTRIIGKAAVDGAGFVIEFAPGHEVSREVFFHIFGHCGFRAIEVEMREGVELIRKASILEWSLCP